MAWPYSRILHYDFLTGAYHKPSISKLLFVMGQIVKVLAFFGHMFFVTVTQLCLCSIKTFYRQYANEWTCLYLYKTIFTDKSGMPWVRVFWSLPQTTQWISYQNWHPQHQRVCWLIWHSSWSVCTIAWIYLHSPFLLWTPFTAGILPCHLVYGPDEYSLVWNMLLPELRDAY